jgi:radical SAM superfamily enzyme YgiQ (UPF0313 family)
VIGRPPTADEIPPVSGATTMGVVEISRGCGLGCAFCTIAHTPMLHVPTDTILADITTNLKAGVRNIALLSEDFFRFGGAGLRVNPEALIAMLRQARALPDLGLLQIDHTNIISVSAYSDAELTEAHRLLVGENHHEYLWVNLGVETASGPLLAANGGAAKMGRHAPEAWGDLCAEQVRRLCAVGFFPLISLVLCLPGETPEDIAQTLAWVKSLRDARISIFPMIYAPVDGSPVPGVNELTPQHWQLISRCYDYNFHWMPHMYWDNQLGGGVPTWKRVLLQGLGLGQVVEWKTLFAWHALRAKRRSAHR